MIITEDIIDLHERSPHTPTPMMIQHPRARYAVWQGGGDCEETDATSLYQKVAVFKEMVTDYVASHGHFVLFENRADAELWFVYR